MKIAGALGLFVVLLCVGCADEDEPGNGGGVMGCAGPLCPDAGDTSPEDEGVPIEGPEPPREAPALPRGTPPEACPSGMFDESHGVCVPAEPKPQVLTPDGGCPGEVSSEGICAPMVEVDIPEACPMGTQSPNGECARIGVACPQGDEAWHAEELLRERAPGYGGDVLYVRAGAGLEPDGSRERPFGQIGQALDAAGDGDIVAVGVGAYDEELSVSTRVAVVGACVEGTSIVGPEGDTSSATVKLLSANGALLSDVRVRGARYGVGVGGAVSGRVLQSVWVERAVGVGVLVASSRAVELADLWVSGTRVDSDSNLTNGLQVVGEGPVQVNRVALVRNFGVGLQVSGDGSQLTAIDLVVSDTQFQQSDAGYGRGVVVQSGASVTLERALVTHNHDVGVLVSGAGSQLTATDLVVSDTQPRQDDGGEGRGVMVQSGASVTLERTLVTRNYTTGVVLSGVGAQLTATDLVVSDTSPRQSDQISGRGLAVWDGAAAQIARAAFVRNTDVGVFVNGVDARLTASDVVITDTQGMGLSVGAGATAQIERATVEHNYDLGVLVSDEGTEATMTDLVVTDTQPRQSDQSSGSGVLVNSGASVELTRGVLTRNHTMGVFVAGEGAEAMMIDVVVSDTQPQRSTESLGIGLFVGFEASARVERFVSARNQTGGVVVSDSARLVASDLVATQTQSSLNNAMEQSLGSGLVVFNGASLELTRGLVERSNGNNVFVWGEGSQATLVDITIDGAVELAETAPIGLVVSVGATAEVQRCAIMNSAIFGVLVRGEGARLTMTDAVIADTQPNSSGSLGLYTLQGASVEMSRAVLTRNHEVGLFASDAETEVTLTDVSISDTRVNSARGGGTGLVSVNGCHVALERFDVSGNVLVGVMLARGGTASASDGVIQGNFIGLNIQDTDIDLDEAFTRVDVRENCCGGSCEVQACNVDTTAIPIPEANDILDTVPSQ